MTAGSSRPSQVASSQVHPMTSSGLLENKHFFEKVFPPGQEFGRGYRGVFRFRFYRQGEWHQVCYQFKI